MEDLHKRIITYGLSVREAEAYASGNSRAKIRSGKTDRKEKAAAEIDPELKNIKERFIDIFGTKVDITGTLEKGKIEISYFSMDDLERLLEIVKPV